MAGQPNDGGEAKFTPWRVAELLFGGGVIVYALTASISGIQWAQSIDDKVSNLNDAQTAIERRIDGLDNVVLGNRVTALDVEVRHLNAQNDSIESKVDRLLEHQSRQP